MFFHSIGTSVNGCPNFYGIAQFQDPTLVLSFTIMSATTELLSTTSPLQTNVTFKHHKIKIPPIQILRTCVWSYTLETEKFDTSAVETRKA